MNEYLGTPDKKILVMLMEKIVMIGSAKDLECVGTTDPLGSTCFKNY